MRLFLVVALFLVLSLREPCISAAREIDRPNVVLIMTDDQGYGDFGFTGNPIIQTPHLDRFASESVFLTHFCVSPVCTPTRASLLTGRYNFRTRAIDTYRGRAMMDPDEVTLAETLSSAGYETGIFGKWHLGDCYPMRPMDQGFKESLVLRGGGLSQPSDPPESTGYFDPVLFRNGELVKTKGYCSDIYTEEAIAFIHKNKNQIHTPWSILDYLDLPVTNALRFPLGLSISPVLPCQADMRGMGIPYDNPWGVIPASSTDVVEPVFVVGE